MSEELERLLRDAPAGFPRPTEEVTRRVEKRLLTGRRRRPASGYSTVALVAATLVGIAIGRWVVPPDDPAIGAAAAPAVTIHVEPKVSPAGHSIRLTGAIVVRQEGERVQIEQNACGTAWSYLKMVQTDDRGAWSASPSSPTTGDVVIPAMRTSYRAVWRGARSATVTVAVRPFVELRFGDRRRVLRASIPWQGVSLSGRHVTFQRLVRGRWRFIRAVRLAETETSAGRRFVAGFRHALPRGTLVRVILTLDQARPCYVGGFSNSLTI